MMRRLRWAWCGSAILATTLGLVDYLNGDESLFDTLTPDSFEAWLDDDAAETPRFAQNQRLAQNLGEPFGAEDPAAEDDRPRIPEPMVFDLVRPLGAKRGELEINTLGLVPFKRRVPQATNIPDPVGLIFTDRLPRVEWAPEIEFAVLDGLALEFELPLEDGIVAAYKAAAQYTFGTAFGQRFIHGMQGILQYDLHQDLWAPTGVYVMGLRINEAWSTLAMIGLRGVLKDDEPANRVERILNLSLFRDLTPHMTAGVESNLAVNMRGDAAMLLMPQVQWELTDHAMLQGGVGARFTPFYTVGEAGFRLIRTF